MAECRICPRRCGVDRSAGETGFCGCGDTVRIARASLHLWEEPCISGTRGSGTIFFSGCNLRCVYCQNYEISHGGKGRNVTLAQLADTMLDLQSQLAHNINLVTPTHYTRQIIDVLEEVKPQLFVPVVYNCGGYESPATIDRLAGLVDVYMPDLKYFSPELSEKYSGAKDYYMVAIEAIRRMRAQVGEPQYDENGIMTRGLLIRHLVLPGCRKDSIELIHRLADTFAPGDFVLSLMSQYTPDYAMNTPYENLHRRVTTLEYESVVREVRLAGFEGYIQERSAASAKYRPDFYG